MSGSAKPTPREVAAAHRLGEAILEMIVASQEGLAERHPVKPPPAPVVRVEHVEPKPAPTPEPLRDPKQALLSTKEAAEYLSVSPRTIWRLASCRDIAPVRIGRTVRFAVAELDAAIKRMQSGRR